MIVQRFLFAVSLVAVIAAIVVPALAEYQILAGLCAVASLYLLLLGCVRGESGKPGRGRSARAAPDGPKNWVVIDGSNVMHWKDGTPQIDVVRDVVVRLESLGYTPGVVFDANAGHLIAGKYQHDDSFSLLLGLPEDRIMVVNKGTPADPTVLLAARDLGARVVSNDRFRDWADTHPEVHKPDHFIRGDYRSGKLRLQLGRAPAAARATKPAS
jgi:hypothetical protein